jgi:hypothetical protein
MELHAGAMSTTFCLTLNGVIATAPDVTVDTSMSEAELLRAIEGAERVQTRLGTIVVTSSPDGVRVDSDTYTAGQIVEVLSAAVARVARIVNANQVRDADR